MARLVQVVMCAFIPDAQPVDQVAVWYWAQDHPALVAAVA
jgi:hypothetical protein